MARVGLGLDKNLSLIMEKVCQANCKRDSGGIFRFGS
jgi:hypothetical protein